MRLKKWCGIMVILTLGCFWTITPMFAEPLTGELKQSDESGMRLFSASEVESLINEMSDVAQSAIEEAVGEAAKAAVLATMREQAASVAQANRDAAKWKTDYQDLKKTQHKRILKIGVVSFGIGLLVGVVPTLFLVR